MLDLGVCQLAAFCRCDTRQQPLPLPLDVRQTSECQAAGASITILSSARLPSYLGSHARWLLVWSLHLNFAIARN